MQTEPGQPIPTTAVIPTPTKKARARPTEPSVDKCASLWEYYKLAKASGFIAVFPMLYHAHYVDNPNAYLRLVANLWPISALEYKFANMREEQRMSVPLRVDMAEYWPLMAVRMGLWARWYAPLTTSPLPARNGLMALLEHVYDRMQDKKDPL